MLLRNVSSSLLFMVLGGSLGIYFFSCQRQILTRSFDWLKIPDEHVSDWGAYWSIWPWMITLLLDSWVCKLSLITGFQVVKVVKLIKVEEFSGNLFRGKCLLIQVSCQRTQIRPTYSYSRVCTWLCLHTLPYTPSGIQCFTDVLYFFFQVAVFRMIMSAPNNLQSRLIILSLCESDSVMLFTTSCFL